MQLLAAVGAIVAGCALLAALGAPLRMPLMNLAALLIGLCILALLRHIARFELPGAARNCGVAALALTVPATALFGNEIDGAARWMVVAGITVLPAMIVVPVVALAFAARVSWWSAGAVAIAAAGVALQPDASAAAMLFLGTAAALSGSPTRLVVASCAFSACALGVSVVRAPALPPVRFVESVAVDALAAGPVTAALLIVGAALVFAPAVIDRRYRPVALSFAGVWLGAFAASLAGAYPTPVLGFGGSAVLGYMLSIGLLDRLGATASHQSLQNPREEHDDGGTELQYV
jgi:cell division protein FtsW (lipid II flippase)